MESSGSLLLLFSLLSHVCLFCDPMVCSLPGASVHGVPQARILWWSGCYFLLLAISQTQGSNPPLMYWQADSLPLSLRRGLLDIESPGSFILDFPGSRTVSEMFLLLVSHLVYEIVIF